MDYPSETITADICTVSCAKLISRRELRFLQPENVSAYVESSLEGMLLELDYFFAGLPDIPQNRIVVDRKWPKDWWQAVKERWAPRWFLRRWPVEYDQVNIDEKIYKAICPHLGIDREAKHVEWLTLMQKQQN